MGWRERADAQNVVRRRYVVGRGEVARQRGGASLFFIGRHLRLCMVQLHEIARPVDEWGGEILRGNFLL